MSNITYGIGDVAQLSVTFTNLAGVPTDPSTVTLTVNDPTGAQVIYSGGSITHISTGNYTYNLSLTLTGVYVYQWTGTGAVQTTQQGTITVGSSLLNGAIPSSLNLVTLDVVKGYLNLTTTGASDVVLSNLITAVSLLALRLTGRGPSDGSIPTQSPFVTPVAYDEFYDGNGNQRQFVRNWPINSVTGVYVNGTPIPASTGVTQPGYVIDGSGKSIVLRTIGYAAPSYRNALAVIGGNYFFARGIQNVEIQYTAGFSAVPYDLSLAVMQTVAQTYTQQSIIYTKSKALPMGGGVVTYGNPAGVTSEGLLGLVVPPQAQATFEFYKRRALV